MNQKEKEWYNGGKKDCEVFKSHPDQLLQECWNIQLDRIQNGFDTLENCCKMFEFYKKGVIDYNKENER